MLTASHVFSRLHSNLIKRLGTSKVCVEACYFFAFAARSFKIPVDQLRFVGDAHAELLGGLGDPHLQLFPRSGRDQIERLVHTHGLLGKRPADGVDRHRDRRGVASSEQHSYACHRIAHTHHFLAHGSWLFASPIRALAALIASLSNAFFSVGASHSGMEARLASGVASSKALGREVRELRKANEILRLASAFFAQAELDRRFKP